MQPTILNIPCNKGYKVQENSDGHGPFIGVYVDLDELTNNCTVTTTLEVGNNTYNYYSGTYLEVYDGDDLLFNVYGNKIEKGKQRIVIYHNHTYVANGHCKIYAKLTEKANGFNTERWNFSTTPIEFDTSKIEQKKDK